MMTANKLIPGADEEVLTTISQDYVDALQTAVDEASASDWATMSGAPFPPFANEPTTDDRTS